MVQVSSKNDYYCKHSVHIFYFNSYTLYRCYSHCNNNWQASIFSLSISFLPINMLIYTFCQFSCSIAISPLLICFIVILLCTWVHCTLIIFQTNFMLLPSSTTQFIHYNWLIDRLIDVIKVTYMCKIYTNTQGL